MAISCTSEHSSFTLDFSCVVPTANMDQRLATSLTFGILSLVSGESILLVLGEETGKASLFCQNVMPIPRDAAAVIGNTVDPIFPVKRKPKTKHVSTPSPQIC